MNVLFVCDRNAGRSQMAQALYERLGGAARSAGTDPADEVLPAVVEAMEELGVDVSARRPRKLESEDVDWADLVVRMGCGDFPLPPEKAVVDWAVADPAGLCIDEVRELRAEVARRVDRLR